MISVENEAGLWVITLNRPEKANALTKAMLEDLLAAVERAAWSRAAALILTGAGKVFSAGADLDAARAGLATDPVWERLSAQIGGFQGLTIAALNGSLAGGAMGMALACDLRIAVPEAKFFYPVMRLGFLPQPSDPGRLVELIGSARAKMMQLTTISGMNTPRDALSAGT